MKKPFVPQIALALLFAALPAMAQTTFFTDTFLSSTTNGLSNVTGSPTASVTSYDIASTKNTIPGTNGVTIAPGDLHLATSIPATSGFLESQAMFRTNGQQLPLASVGDNIEIAVVFTNTAGTLFNSAKGGIWIGLYNSGGALPLTTNLNNSGLSTTAGSPYASGNCAGWQGYVAQINNGGTTKLYTRPVQTGGGTSAAQELVAGGFGSGAFASPGSTTIATAPNPTITLATSGAYTLDLRLTLTSQTSMSISNFIFSGAGIGGPVIFSQGATNGITNGTFLVNAFDGFCIGAGVSVGTPGLVPTMDISSITISGQSSVVAAPPTITLQPVPVVVANNGATEFTINAAGSGVTYQWYRNHAPLSNGGDISGATGSGPSSTLIISPAQAEDAFPTANGYYCVVSGTGGFSTNSVTNSLSLVAPTSLFWSGSGTVWDVATTADWVDGTGTSQVFNYGDPVTLADNAPSGTVANEAVSLSGNFISPSTVKIQTAQAYTIQGSGSIAGPGNVVMDGMGSGGIVIMNANNAYTGGTLLTNDITVQLKNSSGFGTGPVTLNDAGGHIETTVPGSAATGFGGLNVLDDFTFQVDSPGTFALVSLGDLSGSTGKTLTYNPSTTGTTNRFRVYGTNTVFNANLIMNNVDSAVTEALYNGTTFAPYNPSGTQTYNGVISGVGGIAQRGNGETILNNNGNTYSGGTFVTAGSIAFGADTIASSGIVTSGPIGTGPLFVSPEVGSGNGSGTVLAANGARTIANPIEYPTTTNNQTLIIGGTDNLTFTGTNFLNGQNDTTSVVNRTIQVNNTGVITFAGPITDAGLGFGLIKTGTNALYLNAANTYTGITTNSAGLLAGTGSLAGSVVVATNASIGGGTAAAMGTLTIAGNLAFVNGNGFFRVNRSGSSSDKVSVSGTLAANGVGTITVTNLGITLQSGDTFTLFSKAVTGGASLNVTGGGVAWNNQLAANGTIKVQSVIPTYSTNITATVTGTTLGISWPSTHLGWILQSQTNKLSVGISTNWADVANTANVTSTNFTLNASNPVVFYRLRSP